MCCAHCCTEQMLRIYLYRQMLQCRLRILRLERPKFVDLPITPLQCAAVARLSAITGLEKLHLQVL